MADKIKNSNVIKDRIVTDPDYALDLVVKSNPQKLYDNLVNEGFSLDATTAAIRQKLQDIINDGNIELFKRIAAVPIDAENFNNSEIDAINEMSKLYTD